MRLELPKGTILACDVCNSVALGKVTQSYIQTDSRAKKR